MVACVLPLQIDKECFYVLISIHLWAAAPPQSRTGHPFSNAAIVLNLLQAQVVFWRGKLLMS